MKCPICHIHSLQEINLETGLIAHKCSECGGHWISSERYWEWLDYREQAAKALPKQKPPINLSIGEQNLAVVDNNTANFCADCGHLMTKTKVGRGLDFYVDRCSHCHGVWLDKNEWENLSLMNLHHQIHYMFSSAWQFSVRQERPRPQKAPA